MIAPTAHRRAPAILMMPLLLVPLLAALAGPAAPGAEAAVTIWPKELHLQSAPGEEVSAQVELVNRSALTQVVYLYLTDWEPGREPGAADMPLPPGSHPQSLAAFISGGLPAYLELPPHGSTRVSLRIQRPPGGTGTRWTGIAMLSDPAAAHTGPSRPGPGADAGTVAPSASTGPQAGLASGFPLQGGNAARLLRRQRVKIFHTPLPLAPVDVVVGGLAPDPDRQGWWAARVDNWGGRVVDVHGHWRIVDRTGASVAAGPIGPRLLYPGAGAIPFGPVPPLAPGDYHLLAVLQPEGGGPVAGQLTLRVGAGLP